MVKVHPASGTGRKELGVCCIFLKETQYLGSKLTRPMKLENKGRKLREGYKTPPLASARRKAKTSAQVFGRGKVKLEGFEAGGGLAFLQERSASALR